MLHQQLFIKGMDKARRNKRLIICITGMPGAGKSTVATILHNDGFSVITMGDVIREEAIRRNLEIMTQISAILCLNLRKNMGLNAVSCLSNSKKKCNGKQNVTDDIVIDGIRNVAEVNVLRTNGTSKAWQFMPLLI